MVPVCSRLLGGDNRVAVDPAQGQRRTVRPRRRGQVSVHHPRVGPAELLVQQERRYSKHAHRLTHRSKKTII